MAGWAYKERAGYELRMTSLVSCLANSDHNLNGWTHNTGLNTKGRCDLTGCQPPPPPLGVTKAGRKNLN